MNPKQPTVRFEGDYVYKRGLADALSVEQAKLVSIASLSARSDLFVAPTPLPNNGGPELKMSRLHGFQELRSFRCSNADELAWFSRAGEALQEIHAELSLDPEYRTELPAELRFPGPEVWIHGDFTKSNVGVFVTTDGRRRLGIVDWRMTGIYGGEATVGPPLFDIAWFVSGLFMERPDRHLGSWNLTKKADAFVSGYRSRCPDFDSVGFSAYLERLYAVRRVELRQGSLRRRVGLLVGMRRWHEWIGRQG